MTELFGSAVLRRQWKRERLEKIKRPILVAYGDGLDSSAMMMAMHDRGMRPDAVVFADVGGEKEETYRYLPVISRWLKARGWPKVTVVRYRPKKFKNYPPYHDLESNCLSNGTLPSLTFGFKSCSIKWKAAPQEKWCMEWRVALETWGKGQRIVKLIGFDDSKGDQRRSNHAGNADDPKYEYRYPLQEWGMTRSSCVNRIIREQLPGWNPGYLDFMPPTLEAWKEFALHRTKENFKEFTQSVAALRSALFWVKRGGIPMKSSCWFCPAMKIPEVCLLPKEKLQRIVMMEARARPRHHTVKGLWRKATKIKPGSMTEFIRLAQLLPAKEIKRLEDSVPPRLRRAVDDFRNGMPVEPWEEFFENVGVQPMGFCGDFYGE